MLYILFPGVSNDSKDWTHSNWLTEKERAAEIGAGGAWSTIYDHEADSQTVNRILPLIVEEENINSCTSFDLDLPQADHSEQEPKTQHSIMPQMSRDSSNSLRDESMISIPKLLRDDDPNPVNVSLPFYQTAILPSPSLAPEKREFCRTYDNARRHQDSATIYGTSYSISLLYLSL